MTTYSKYSKITALIFSILLCVNYLTAAYLKYEPVKLNQPDGTELNIYASGDEFYNWLHDKDGFTIKQDSDGWYKYIVFQNNILRFTTFIPGRDNPSINGLKAWENITPDEMSKKRQQRYQEFAQQGMGRAPHNGTLNNIVVFIRFSDQTEFTDNISTYSSMFNGTTGNTMQSYFLEASYNALNISTTFYPAPSTIVVSWQDSHVRAYFSPYNATTNTIGYQNDTERTLREHTLLVAAVNGVRSQIPTSLNVDGDNDGKVDNVCFVVKGATDGWAELLWPHRWSLYTQFVYINSKRVYDYNFQLSNSLSSSGNGVLCHEMFHSLGAPDLYHYSYDGLSTVGSWDLMENNSNPPEHMSAYMKYKYGLWISSIPIISTAGNYTLNPLTSSTNNCYRINSPNSSTEYFVLEFRKKAGTFESSIPNSGLLIYRINTGYSGNASGPPDEVYAYRPNGTTSVNGDISNAFFSEEAGRIIFNQYTNPTCFLTNGSTGGISLQNIGSSAGATMSFRYSTDNPLADLKEGFENGFTALPWTFSGNANWQLDATNYYTGTKSAKSGTVTHSQTSSMQVIRPITESGQVSFFYKVSSESNYDFLKFYIDGVLKSQWSGEVAWSMTAYNIGIGDHTFKWEYYKDGSVSSGSDCSWVDQIGYPTAVFNNPRNLSFINGNNVVGLSWDAPLGSLTPSSYKVFRNGVYLVSTTLPNYSDNTVTNDVSYTYYITAVYSNPTGESTASNSVVASPTGVIVRSVGNGTTVNQGLPVEPYYGYTYSQSIFYQADLNITNKRITHIAWQYNGNSAWTDSIKVYLGHTTLTEFATTASWVPLSSLSMVYNGDLNVTAVSGWVEITLNTPFIYDNTKNLVIAVDENKSGYHSSADEFYNTTVTENRSLLFYSDSINPDPANPPTSGSNLYRRTSYPNIKLTFNNIPAVSILVVDSSPLNYGEVALGSNSVKKLVINNQGGATLTGSIITPSGWTISLSRDSEPRNAIGYAIASASFKTYNLQFNPTISQVYSGNLQISSNDVNHPSTLISLTGIGYRPPAISISSNTVTTQAFHGESNQALLQISNSGDKDLVFYTHITDTSALRVSEYNRSISGSTITVNAPYYQPGSTMDLIFSVYNASTDSEWLKDVSLCFPQGITVNSSSDLITTNSHIMPTNNATGNGANVIWHGETTSGWGIIQGNETGVSTVSITVPLDYIGNISIPYQLTGDIYGALPHTLNGTVNIPQYQAYIGWLTCNPISDVLLPGQQRQLTISLNSTQANPGQHSAIVRIFSNDPANPIKTINISYNVGLSTPQILSSIDQEHSILSWLPVSGANRYAILYSTEIDGNYTTIETTPELIYIIPSNVNKGFYKVVAQYIP